MPRANTMLPLSILIGAAVIAGAITTNPADATRTRTAAQGDIGVIDVYHLIDIMILGENYSDERVAYENNSQERLALLEQQLQQFQSQLQTMNADDPQASQIYGQYQQMAQVYQQTNQSVNQGYQEMLSRQIADAYSTIHAAANDVAAEQGYTFVIATRRSADLAEMTSLTGVTQEILSRPLVTPPESVDLTEAVRTSLDLPTAEEAQEAARAAAEARNAQVSDDAVDPLDTMSEPQGTNGTSVDE